MLLGVISLSEISSSAISSSAISMIASPGLPQYGNIVVLGLIVLLSLKEVLSEAEQGSIQLYSSFNMAILSLFLCFLTIASFKMGSVILLI